MSQAAPTLRLTDTDAAPVTLPGLPRRALTVQERLEAVQRLQKQAQQRLQLGSRLFEAAKGQTDRQQQMLEDFKKEQATLREQMRSEMAQTFRQCDQHLHEGRQDTAGRLDDLTRRLDTLESGLRQQEERLAKGLRRAEAILEQSRYLMAEAAAAIRRGGIAADATQRPTLAATTTSPGDAPNAPPPTPSVAEERLADVYLGLIHRLHQQDGGLEA